MQKLIFFEANWSLYLLNAVVWNEIGTNDNEREVIRSFKQERNLPQHLYY